MSRPRNRTTRAATRARREAARKVAAEVAEAVAKAAPYAHLPVNWQAKTFDFGALDDRGYLNVNASVSLHPGVRAARHF